MLRSIRTWLAAVLVLSFAPAALVAQEPAQPQLSPEVQGWMAELRQIRAELAAVQEQALGQDPALQEEQQRVTAAVQETMLRLDPTLPEQTRRIEALQQEAQAAIEVEDVERIIELSAEAQEIRYRFAMVQAEAIQQPGVAPQVEAFQSRLRARMTEIDPRTETRLQRLEELERRIATALHSSQTP